MATALPTDASAKLLLQSMKFRLAAQLIGGATARALSEMADRCEHGELPSEVLASGSWKAPSDLRNLMRQACETDAPGEVLWEIMQQEAKLRGVWRELVSSLIYPAGLLLGTLGLLTAFDLMFPSSTLTEWLKEMGLRSDHVQFVVADQQNAVRGIGIVLAWCCLMFVSLKFAATKLTQLRVLSVVPMFGTPYRWLELSRLLGRVAVFSYHRKTLVAALDSAGQSLGERGLGRIAERVSERLGGGDRLGFSLHASVLSDMRAGALLAVLDASEGAIGEQLKQTAELLVTLTSQLSRRLQVILPVVLLLVVASLIGGVIANYFAFFGAMVQMITSLA